MSEEYNKDDYPVICNLCGIPQPEDDNENIRHLKNKHPDLWDEEIRCIIYDNIVERD